MAQGKIVKSNRAHIYQTTKTDEQKCQKMVKKSIPLMNEQFPLLPELIFRIHYYYPTNL